MQRCKEYRRRVGKGFPAHGLCQEGWERDFPPTGATHGGISHPRGVSRRVGKGFPTHGGHPWGDFSPTGCVKKGGKGISHPRGATHGGISHPWLVSRRVGKGFPTHGGISHPRLVSRRVGKGFPTHGGHPWGDFPSTGRGCLLWSVRPVVAALSVPAIASVSAAAGAAVAESPESAITVDNAGDGQLGFLAHGQKFNKLFT